jgi:hypothetical protein
MYGTPDRDTQEWNRSEGKRGKPVKFTNKEIRDKANRLEKANKFLKKTGNSAIKPSAK